MLTPKELQRVAWKKIRVSKTLLETHNFEEAAYTAGYAVEIILKARACVDLNFARWPKHASEFKLKGIPRLHTHDLTLLLDHTHVPHIAAQFPVQWGHCLKWSPEMRYAPLGSANLQSASELIESAEVILRAVNDASGLTPSLMENDNPYVKLAVVADEIDVQLGPLWLFMLVHRANASETSSDLLVAAPWIDRDWKQGIEAVAKAVYSRLTTESERRAITGIIHLECNHPIVECVTKSLGRPMPDKHGELSGPIVLQNWPTMSAEQIHVTLEKGLILRSQRFDRPQFPT